MTLIWAAIKRGAIGLAVGALSAILALYLWLTNKALRAQMEASRAKAEAARAEADRERAKADLAAQAEKAQRAALDKVRQKLREDYDHAEYESREKAAGLRGPDLLTELRKTIAKDGDGGGDRGRPGVPPAKKAKPN